jgi:glyoxylate reductase
MSKPKVLVTKLLPGRAPQLLSDFCDAEINRESRSLSKEELVSKIRDKAGLLSFLSDVIDREIIDAGKHLKVIANYAVGYNNIDWEHAKARGIFVTNTPDVLTDATADIAWSLILALTRRIVPADRFTREGKFKGWDAFLFQGRSVQEKTLGIIGMGRIGSAVAKRGVAFGMKILYHDLHRAPAEMEEKFKAEFISFDDILKQADILTLHVPLTDQNRGMIGESELSRMKGGAFLINTARGELVNEKALVRTLKSGHLGGAGFDVYEKEPEIEKELMGMDNVVLLPHIGSATVEVREKMALMAVENVISALKGEKPPNSIS